MSINQENKPLSGGESERFADRYVLGYDKREGSEHFLRIKIPNGKLTGSQFKAIAALSHEYGKGYSEITDRQNIQLHWIPQDKGMEVFKWLDEIGFSTDHGGQGVQTASRGDVRAIAGCPAAGVDKDELIDVQPLVNQIDCHFDGNKAFLDMPRKFKISISGCRLNCLGPDIHDMSFIAANLPSGEVEFSVFVGGTVATAPQLAKPLGVLVKPEEVLDVARCTVELFRDNTSRESKAKARFRWLVDAWGTEKLRASIEKKLGKKLEPYKLKQLPICKGEHIGVQPQKQAEYSFISVPIISGVLSSERMVQIAEVAEEFGNGDLRLSGYQNIIIANIPNAKVNSALEQLKAIEAPVEGSPLRWSTVACAGNFCGKTIDHPKNRAKETIQYLEQRFGGDLKAADVRVGFSGCPNGCARHLVSDIGLQGSVLMVDGKPVPAYNLYVGVDGELGRLVKQSIDAAQVKFAVGNLIAAYLKDTAGKRFRDFTASKTDAELEAILKGQ